MVLGDLGDGGGVWTRKAGRMLAPPEAGRNGGVGHRGQIGFTAAELVGRLVS